MKLVCGNIHQSSKPLDQDRSLPGVATVPVASHFWMLQVPHWSLRQSKGVMDRKRRASVDVAKFWANFLMELSTVECGERASELLQIWAYFNSWFSNSLCFSFMLLQRSSCSLHLCQAVSHHVKRLPGSIFQHRPKSSTVLVAWLKWRLHEAFSLRHSYIWTAQNKYVHDVHVFESCNKAVGQCTFQTLSSLLWRISA